MENQGDSFSRSKRKMFYTINVSLHVVGKTSCYCGNIKEKQSRYGPGVAQTVPGGLSSQIIMTFDT